MKKPIGIAFLGGDERQKYAAEAMRDLGNDVLIWGLGTLGEGIKVCGEAIDAVGRCDAIVLPIRVTTDGHNLDCSLDHKARLTLSELSRTLPPTIPVFGGILPTGLADIFAISGIRYINYFDREEFQVKNALLTAEGALALAIEQAPISILGSNIAVLGYGRIGKFLSDILNKLGAHVTVFARKKSDLATAQMHGLSVFSFSGNIAQSLTNRFDIVYNTVPHLLIDEDILSRLRHDVVIVDLASAPGGVDFGAAKKYGIKTIAAPGLPGKVSPKSAGEIVAETIVHLLNEEEYFT